MASLPPYSTYRTDSKQMMFPQATSHGNILTFVPPGFNQELSVKFPDSRLAVCKKCKKNFKTRDMCRVRNAHTTTPWTTAYICVTIDDSCLDGHGRYVEKPMTVRMVQWQPYCVLKPFDAKTPVCSACKRTNRTKSFCRERHKHRLLPWSCVYVLLSALDAADPSTVVAGASKKVGESDEETCNGAGDTSPGDESSKAKSEDANSVTGDTIASDNEDPGDDIHDIHESRTFLAKVSCRSISVHWLELSDYDPNEAAGVDVPTIEQLPYHMSMSIPSQVMETNHIPANQYYPPNMNIAALQHQNALKSRQQYFFQMQQQQQQYAPPGAVGIWQHQPTMYHNGPSAQAEQGAEGGSATEGTAEHITEISLPPQQHWAAMYYQTYLAAPPDANGQDHETPGAGESAQHRFNTNPDAANSHGDDQQADNKRQRVV